jgi:hypothetical protein
VLDPFLGTGTTLRAAAAAGRNSIGCEIDPRFRTDILSNPRGLIALAARRIRGRLDEHLAFVDQCRATGRALKHLNRPYGFPVVTGQETELLLDLPEEVSPVEPDGFQVSYSQDPRRILDPQDPLPAVPGPRPTANSRCSDPQPSPGRPQLP